MRLSIIVPTLDEEDNLRALLPELAKELTRAEADTGGALRGRVVISDGGSEDRTRQVALEAGCLLVEGEAGRGPQLNRGAEAALADGAQALLFLHADTRLPAGALEAVAEVLRLGTSASRGGVPGGAFEVRFDDPGKLFRLGDRLVNWRTRWTGVPLGDQAQFVSAEAFRHLGGYRNWPILEDLDFMRRLKALGKPAILAGPVVTAARRYRRRGVTCTILRNWLIWGLYFAGASPHRLARFYRDVR